MKWVTSAVEEVAVYLIPHISRRIISPAIKIFF